MVSAGFSSGSAGASVVVSGSFGFSSAGAVVSSAIRMMISMILFKLFGKVYKKC